MNLLDAYALITTATGTAGAGEVAELLRGGGCEITTANLAELYDQLVRGVGVDPDAVDARLRPLLDESLALRGFDRERAARGGIRRPARQRLEPAADAALRRRLLSSD